MTSTTRSESHSSLGDRQSDGDGDDDSNMFGFGSSSPISGDFSMDSLDGDHDGESQLPLNFPVGLAAATPGTQRDEMSIRWPNKPLQITPFTPAKRTIDGVLLHSQRQSDTELKQFLQSLNSSELVNFGLQSVQRLNGVLAEKAEWKKQNKSQLQTIRRLRSRLEKLQDKNKEGALVQVEKLDVEKRGSRLTFKGSVALGIRKAMGLISAASFPMISLVDSSRWTVTRSEVHGWALVVARSRAFHKGVFSLSLVAKQRQQIHLDSSRLGEADPLATSTSLVATSAADLPDTVQPPGLIQSQEDAILTDCGLPLPVALHGNAFQAFKVGATFFSGDATNTSIWQRQKLQGLETSSTFLVNYKAFLDGNLTKAFVRFRQM